MVRAQRDITVAATEAFRKNWEQFIRLTIKADFVEPVSTINNGYLHTFNASFDGLFLREQQSDSLLRANHPMMFGTIQPCIRIEDKLTVKHSSLHLGLFDICGFSVLDFSPLTAKDMAEATIKEFLIFYGDYLQLERDLLRVYYFGGGTLREITQGKIKSDDYIEPDNFSVDIWRSLGLADSQLICDFTNETFLLHLGNPLRAHHSGYRNDIYIQLPDANFEIGTLNFISHQTVIDDGEIVGLKPLPFYLREMAIGQERFLAAGADISDLYRLPYINPLLEAVSRNIPDLESARIYVDALRVIHYLFSDGWIYDRLRGRRYREHRNELNRLMEIIVGMGQDLTETEDVEALTLNAELQPWYPQLISGTDITIREIQAYRKRRPHLNSPTSCEQEVVTV